MVAATATPELNLPIDVRLVQAATRWLTGVAVLAIGAVGLGWVARQPYFALHQIRIEGDVARNSASTIRANAAPRLAGNFFSLDLQRARGAFESVPWVRADSQA